MRKRPLQLEVNRDIPDAPCVAGAVKVSSPHNERYFMARVKLGCTGYLEGTVWRNKWKGQALVCVPEDGTMVIRYTQEFHGHKTRPASEPAETIFEHIKANRGLAKASDAETIRAIEMLRAWASAWREKL